MPIYNVDEYQKEAVKLASYPNVGNNLVYPALGLSGEAGEVAEKVKKLWRNSDTMTGQGIDPSKQDAIVKELSDVLWYCAAIASELQVDLSYVLEVNIDKLQDRHRRGVIKSEGDNR